jgi:hypothetical protein
VVDAEPEGLLDKLENFHYPTGMDRWLTREE